MHKKEKEIKVIYGAVFVLFLVFLAVPLVTLMLQSFQGGGSFSFQAYAEVFGGRNFARSVANSFLIAGLSALVTTVLAFFLAYTIHHTNVNPKVKSVLQGAAVLPMLLPTITYGFAIIYSFGKQGLLTKLLGFQPFNIYGIGGLLLGYVIYTFPIAFMLINNTFRYIDKKFILVSRLMADRPMRTFYMTTLRPLLGTLGAAFIQSFFLSFTDFGIPAAVGGKFEVVATTLYTQMLGAVPNFNNGAVVAMVMLVPSVFSILILGYLERFNFRYNKVTPMDVDKNPIRDVICGTLSLVMMLILLSIFAVILVIPFVEEWPYRIQFTTRRFTEILNGQGLMSVYQNSLWVALLTAVCGTLVAYGAALVTARSSLRAKWKKGIDGIALITNTIPGMVLGIAFLLAFSDPALHLKSTFAILILCNMVHFFSTPYLMMKNSLSKMNSSWETTALLMGDSWFKTIVRVVTPNASATILEVFSYYFINSMVTISAVIFLVGARTTVITTKITELQHYAKFDEIFVLSLLILMTNLAAKGLLKMIIIGKQKEEKSMKKIVKSAASLMLAAALTFGLAGCGANAQEKQVVIYSNADEEAMTAMKKALDENGYQDQYILQSFGTSELGGKILAEGKNLEADLITMSTFYIDSAQEQNEMFTDLTFVRNTLKEFPEYEAPITSQEGAIMINTEELKAAGLVAPTSFKDLAKPEYEGHISIPDITGSSTSWLMVQAIVSAYDQEEAKEVMTGLIKNAGPHLESSGSAPLKKLRAGEVAIGFGLRHQAVADKAKGLPIDYVDPTEGNYSLTESVAVVDKGEKTNSKAMEMAEVIIKKGRSELIKTYPNPVYEGETSDPAVESKYPKEFSEKLTVDLLKQHQEFSESCK